jgi:signal transduction histidine kinase
VSAPTLEASLYRLAALATEVDDPAIALRRILEVLIGHFRADSGSIALLNPDTGRLEIEAQQGLPDDYREVTLRLGQGITGWVAFHGRPQFVPDVRRDARYVRLRPSVHCEIAAPMEEHGQVLGVVNLDSDRPDGFTRDDLDALIRLTAQATAVLQRLWQLQQLRGKARQFESLIGIGQALVAKVEERDLFETVTRDARLIMQARACGLYLHDPTRGALRLVALSNPDSTLVPRPGPADDLPLETSAIGAVIQTRRALEFANIQSPEYIDVVDLPVDPRLRSLLATPLVFEGEVLGVLAIFTEQIHRFNNDEKRLGATLASLAAVALQNARLYARVFRSEDSLRKNEQLTTLGLLAAEIAHEIRNPLTVIKLLFGYLNLEFPTDDPRRTDVRVIGEKLDQLEAIVSRVLQFGKAPASLHAPWVLADLVEDTALLIRLKLAQGKIALRVAPIPRALVVEVHKGQIQQVLLNLLFNSTQAMPNGGTITLQTTTEERAGGGRIVHIDVADTGSGIPERLRAHIFDNFLSGRPDGTGLGLGIAKRILLSHSGDIQLIDTSAAGTTLRLTLPLTSPS